jgi:NADH:ubiquinone oxidoreductase subunit 5 (chain L)/Multisubunit Na+/H+ antiporter, MnhA subunit
MTNLPLWLIPLFPLVGTVLLGAIAVISSGSKKGPAEGIVGFLAVIFPVLAFASVVLLAWGMPAEGLRQTLCNWIDIPLFKVDIGFLFDGLSRIMLLFVTGIGSLIALYSIGYMHGDRGFARFFAYINLFLFSMIVLVLSDSLLLTFLGWEGVGLCSYLLIGFWNKDLSNCKAANKAFIVNRVGDIGFLLGMLCLVTVGGSEILNYDSLSAFIQMLIAGGHVEIVLPLLSLAGLLFFIGCTGKSAQIPLLTWSPTLCGSTPVSALIHAATMVTSRCVPARSYGQPLLALAGRAAHYHADRPCDGLLGCRGWALPERHQEGTCLLDNFPAGLHVHGSGFAPSTLLSSTCLHTPSSRRRSSSVPVP